MKTKSNYLSILVMIVLAVTLFAPESALAATTVTVQPTAMNGWGFIQETATGTGSLVSGPGTPPLNSGSARFVLDATGRELLGTVAYAGTRLDQITNLEYSTYRSSADAGNLLAVTLQLDTDYDLTDASTAWQGRLVFEPYFTIGSGNIPQNTWQTWSPMSGNWWMTGTPIVGDASVTNPCPQSSPCSWSTILTTFPNAGLRAGIGVLQFKAGGPWPGFDGNVDAFTMGVNGDDTTYDFEPEPACSTVCYADAVSGNDANGGASTADAKKTIQAAIDAVSANGTVRVLPGNYDETAANRFVLGTNGPHQFGLFIDKDGITIQGVDASDVPITNYNALGAYVTTNATNNFGASGIFVQGDSVTLAGLHIGHNIPGDNKTIEIIGDGFTLKDSHVDVPGGGSVYFNDWQFDTANDISHVQSYTIDHNLIDQSTSIDLTSGAGYSGPESGRQIVNNEFINADFWPSISFNGSGTNVPWFVQSVGGAVIENNSFTNTFNGTDVTAAHIRVRGTVDDSQFDWTSYWNDNTFNKAVVTLVGAYPPFDVRQYNYTSGSYSFDTRRIGVNIQSGVDKAQAGDTVLVKAGTYIEHVTINKSLDLLGANSGVDGRGARGSESIIDGGLTSAPLQITANDVKVDGFTIRGGANGLASGIHIPIGASTGYEILNNIITDNSIGIYANCAGSCLIQHNLFDANNQPGSAGGSGIYSEGTTGLTVDENEFKNHTLNNPVIFAAVAPSSHTDLTFTENLLHDNISGVFALAVSGGLFQANEISTSPAATAITFGGGSSNIDVLNNKMDNNLRGLRVIDFGFGFGPNSNITANQNNVASNSEYGIGAPTGGYTGGPLNAEKNWWGSASGPAHTSNPGGTGSPTTDDVDFTPWLCDGTDTSAAIGFQPNLNTLCGAATKLVFSTQPGDGVAGSPLSTQPVVQAVDDDGNVDPNFNGAVTLTINNNPGGGTLGGTATVNAVNGVATFTDISIDQPGVGYTLDANGGALTGGTSDPFDVTAAGPAPAACLAYGVQDTGSVDTQFFTLDPATKATANLGPLYPGSDFETLDIDPTTGIIYAATSGGNAFNQEGHLFLVDGLNGSLFLVGPTGQKKLEALAFRPTDGTLWGWVSGKGIVTLNKTTGAATIVKADKRSVEGLAWNNSGTLLYFAKGKNLFSYNPANGKISTIAKNMPGPVEALDMRPDDLLAIGVDGKSTLYAYNPVTKQFVSSQNITGLPYKDIEGISWPECGE